MRPQLRVFPFLFVLLGAGANALAATDCSDPIASWKPRDALQHQVEQYGWSVQRIKVDDGCYELRGRDRKGNKIKAKYSPATLRLRSIEIDFGSGGDATDYLVPPPAGAVPARNRDTP
ncbi:PepSY domain-containing protein [Massilia sp. PWRC2]|uniref:PepSY domain-containing protein n=1 Tax=Massilia sp. PWRC2 TaxID=2804626 RepID=UPI003CE88154